jgi:DsbC/DsbD-like thiol-disulfide interchange protein
MKLLQTLFLSLAVLAGSGAAQAVGPVVTTPQVRAELVAHAPEGVAPGKPLWLGLKIEHQRDWHTYWKNPGDSGLPTKLNFTLPDGMLAGPVQWPTPSRLPTGPLMNYGYADTLLLPVAVTVPAGFMAESLDIRLQAEWLVCKDVCIPESGEFSLRLPAQAASAAHAALFASAQAAVPQPAPGTQATAAVRDGSLLVQVSGLPEAWRGKTLQFFPETTGVIHNAAVPQASWQGDTWSARVPLDPQRTDSPTAMPVVLTTAGQPAGLVVQLAVTTPWPALAPPQAEESLAQLPAEAALPPTPPLSLGLALLAALAGGALLNLMPCVFPVLSLKVLGFSHHAHDRRGCCSAGWPTPLAWCCPSSRWPRCCWPCAPAANSWAGASSSSRRRGGRAGGVVHADRSEPGGCVRSSARCCRLPLAAARARATRWSIRCSPACWPWPWRRPARRPSWARRWGWPSRCPPGRPWRSLPRSAWAWPCPTWPPAPGRRWRNCCRGRAVDGALQDADGLPDVRHRGLAGVGAGPADRHRWRRGLAGAAAGAGLRRLGPGFADAGCRVRAAGFGAAALVLGGRLLPGRADAAPVSTAQVRRRTGWQAWSPERVAEAARRRAAGVRRLHRRLVRDLPVQQAHHAGHAEVQADFRRATWRCCAPTGRAATPPSAPNSPAWAAAACRSMRCMPLALQGRAC